MSDLVRKTEVINELIALTAYNTKLEITKVIEADLSRMDKWLGGVEDCLNAIESIQPVDAVPVVRCGECAKWKHEETESHDFYRCEKGNHWSKKKNDDWFCADGKSKGVIED